MEYSDPTLDSPGEMKPGMASRGNMQNRQDNRIFLWTIDPEDKIIRVNEAWLAFARENAAPQLVPNAVINRSLWDFVSGGETIHLYHLILEKVRKQKLALIIPFRCDSPDCRRFMEMEISTLGRGEIQFRSRVLRLEFRPAVRALEQSGRESGQFLRICSWCKKICISTGQWIEIEAAVKSLDLFASDELPQLTHGICESCYELVRQNLAN